MNPNPYRPSASGLLTLIVAVLVGIGLYQADFYNVPVIAPWLDFIAPWLMKWVPIFTLFGPKASMVASATTVAFVFFIAATLVVAILMPTSKVGRMENEIRGIQNTRKPDSVKIK